MDGVNVARADDRLEEVDSLLGAAGLPASDVRSAPARFDVVSGGGEAPGGGNRDGNDGSGVVGVSGLELSGTAGLFRSVAVREGARGAGVGTVVCEHLAELQAGKPPFSTSERSERVGRGYTRRLRLLSLSTLSLLPSRSK